MSLRKQHLIVLALVALFLGSGTPARAQVQEEKRLSPALDQLRETLADRLQAVADKLGLTAEQRDKIREAHTAFTDKYQTLRTQRRELLQTELQALGAILSPEQRDMAKQFIEDRIEAAREGVAKHEWPEIGHVRDTLTERLQGAAEKLGLTDDQRDKIREAHAPFAEKYRAQRAERRELIESELRAISHVLTPEQREKVRNYIDGRIVRAAVAQTVAERLNAAADKLGLTSEQRGQLREIHAPFREKYRAMGAERRKLLQSELKAISAVLTPEQREKVRDFFEDRVIVVGIEVDPNDPQSIAQLRETVAERLNAAADKLGLTAEQRDKIREAGTSFREKYRAQMAERRELRQSELQALGKVLTPEQREKARNFVEDRIERFRQDR
jgi:Spy/CpxP family protein refolding chaperone